MTYLSKRKNELIDKYEICNNPDHGFIDSIPGDVGRLGCPGCGHNPNKAIVIRPSEMISDHADSINGLKEELVKKVKDEKCMVTDKNELSPEMYIRNNEYNMACEDIIRIIQEI